jgi:hypothetical protein
MSLRKLAAALLLALPASTIQAPLPGLRVEAADGGSVLHVKNTASQPLTAFLIQLVDYPGSSFSLWEDNIDADPIAAGAEKRIPITNMTVGAAPEYVKMQAAVYADGATAGVPDKIAGLLERRRAQLETTRELIRRIEKSKAAGAPAASLTAELRTWAESIQTTGKVARSFPAGMVQASVKGVVANTAGVIEKKSVDEALAGLRTVERTLAASKPGL